MQPAEECNTRYIVVPRRAISAAMSYPPVRLVAGVCFPRTLCRNVSTWRRKLCPANHLQTHAHHRSGALALLT